MARKKITEYLAKSLLFKALDKPYSGFSVDANALEKLDSLDASKSYVAKVDQGVKKRNKLGLVIINKSIPEIKDKITEWQKQGYTQFLIEDFVPHQQKEEYYLAIERVREGYAVHYSNQGGVDIESHADSVKEKIIASKKEIDDLSVFFSLDDHILKTILDVFDANYFSFLEINPLVVVAQSKNKQEDSESKPE